MASSSEDVPQVSDVIVTNTQTQQSEDGVEERWIDLSFTWSGKGFTIRVAESDRVYDLKAQIYNQTRVPAERQKIIGLVKGRLPPEQERIGDLKLTNGKKFSLIGTCEGDEIKDPSHLELLPDVVNDLDIDFSADPVASVAYQNDQRNKRKILETTAQLELNIINPLRPGKRLLVLDIDYTIVDTKPLTSGALPPIECIRPHLHEFLEAVYPYYDICFWSQTHWRWIESKLVEMGIFDIERGYKIAFILDKSSMFTVFSQRNGQEWAHQVKALQVIWNKLPQFSPQNTVHIDDLGRNFALNPGQGLKIHAFKECHSTKSMGDRELLRLGRYLCHIASQPDFQILKHKNWHDVLRLLPPP